MNLFPYRDVFLAVEKRLIEVGSRQISAEIIQEHLNKFKGFKGRDLSDDQYFLILVFVAFYSGFKAATVTSRREIIEGYFSNWKAVSNYSDQDIKNIIADPKIIGHEGKIRGCVANAKTFGALISTHGSIKKYIASYSPEKSFENLLLLKKSLQASFAYLGNITVYHFMTDIGLPVLKPDRVICRTFDRLGLLKSHTQLSEAILQGGKFAEATGYPIRYIDIVFVAYGQVRSEDIGLTEGICLKNPRCHECSIRSYCEFTPKTEIK